MTDPKNPPARPPRDWQGDHVEVRIPKPAPPPGSPKSEEPKKKRSQ